VGHNLLPELYFFSCGMNRKSGLTIGIE